jgi:rhodanese-related sulfurtransferase
VFLSLAACRYGYSGHYCCEIREVTPVVCRRNASRVSTQKQTHVARLATAISLVGLAIPLIFVWLIFGRTSNISAPDAKRLLQDASTILVTVDPTLSMRLPESSVWPLPSIMQMHDASQVPDGMRDKAILLICPGGIQSARAALHLRRIGVDRVFSVWGGFQEWITQESMRPIGQRMQQNFEAVQRIPFFRPSPMHEQFVAVLTFFGIKSIYSILAAFLAILLWRVAASDLGALRRSMVAFFVGEGFCFVNVVIFGDHNLLFEHLHSVGMVVSLAFFIYALLEGLDSRLFHFSDDGRCAAMGLCGACFKHSDATCGLRRMFLLSVPLLGVAAALPLFSTLRDTAYNTLIFGTVYGYRHPLMHQLYEIRYLPAAAVVLFAFCFITLLLIEHRKVQLSKVLFSAAAGAMAFSYFRLLLVAAFVERQVWFAAWEETSELIYILLAGSALCLFPGIYPFAAQLLRLRGEGSRA